MASSRHVDTLVHRLETAIAQEIHGRGRVALAYSGGLASTLIAMLARKRWALASPALSARSRPRCCAHAPRSGPRRRPSDSRRSGLACLTALRWTAQAFATGSANQDTTETDRSVSIPFVRITKRANFLPMLHRSKIK